MAALDAPCFELLASCTVLRGFRTITVSQSSPVLAKSSFQIFIIMVVCVSYPCSWNLVERSSQGSSNANEMLKMIQKMSRCRGRVSLFSKGLNSADDMVVMLNNVVKISELRLKSKSHITDRSYPLNVVTHNATVMEWVLIPSLNMRRCILDS